MLQTLRFSPPFQVLSSAWVACFLVLSGWQTAAGNDTLMSHSSATRLGLTEAWRRGLNVPAGAQSIVDQRLFVDAATSTRYVELIRAGAETGDEDQPIAESDVLWRMRADQVGRDGNPLGENEVKRLARLEALRLARKGIEAEVATREIPVVWLYTLSDDGTLECRDAESGRTRWVTQIGDRRLTYRSLGLDSERISVINGGNLIVVDAADGSVLNRRRTINAPGSACVHVGKYVLIPSIGSGVEGHLLDDPGAEHFFERVSGAALHVPTAGQGTLRCAWGTVNGYVYVMELEGEPSVLFRLDTDGLVGARIVAAGDRFFFATDAGQVYAVRSTREGQVLWTRPFGEPFFDPPGIHQNTILLRSGYGNLYSLAAGDGAKNWPQPAGGVDQILAVIEGRIYVRTLAGHFAVLDLESGDTVMEMPEVQPTNVLINRVSDRLYLLSDSGTVQCLRPETSELPQLKVMPDPLPEEPEDAPEEPSRPRPAEPTDPFGAPGEDPFGAPDEDPFGAPGADPFGGDPFGGDPFGDG